MVPRNDWGNTSTITLFSEAVAMFGFRLVSNQAFYVDQDFPPNDSSLGPTLAATDLITWRRPAQFPGATTTAATAAFGGYGPPRPSDVRPCAFAMDASLACALAALAERPRLVSAALCGRVEQVVSMTSTGIKDGGRGDGGGEGKGFRTESGAPRRRSLGNDNSEWDRTASKRTKATAAAAKASTAASQAGMFSARLCVDGIWKEYVLDDYFPCLSSWSEGFPGGCTSSSRNRSSNGGGVGSAGGPCLSRAHGPALWVSMLEKAYARAVGSYSEALGGCCLSLGRGAKGETGGPGVVGMASATGAVARPANILGVFTGAPVLQVELSGARLDAGEEEAGRSRGSDCTDGKQAANVLWESIVSRLWHCFCFESWMNFSMFAVSRGLGGARRVGEDSKIATTPLLLLDLVRDRVQLRDVIRA